MGDPKRSEIWLSILGSLLRGTDIALLKDPAELAKITDRLEELHHERFGFHGQVVEINKIPVVVASNIVAKWSGAYASSTSNKIMCLRELRTEFNLSLKEAEAFMDVHWNDPVPPPPPDPVQLEQCPVCSGEFLPSDLLWDVSHKANVCYLCRGEVE
jgi:hypothetical protein